MILWSVEDSQLARIDPLRPYCSMRLLLDRLLDGGHGLTHPLLTSAANAAAR